MANIDILEWIGYLASVTVAISLMMTSMLKLRWLNLTGALVFTIYGIAIQAIPVAAVNAFIVIIDIYYLYKLYASKDYFEIIEVNETDSYLKSFLSYYQKDIKTYFPHFDHQIKKGSLIFCILRNMDIAGVFIGHQEDEKLTIDLDYAIPKYQDYKTGRFLFKRNIDVIAQRQINLVEVEYTSKAQLPYYKRMGFIKLSDSSQVLQRHLS